MTSWAIAARISQKRQDGFALSENVHDGCVLSEKEEFHGTIETEMHGEHAHYVVSGRVLRVVR